MRAGGVSPVVLGRPLSRHRRYVSPKSLENAPVGRRAAKNFSKTSQHLPRTRTSFLLDRLSRSWYRVFMKPCEDQSCCWQIIQAMHNDAEGHAISLTRKMLIYTHTSLVEIRNTSGAPGTVYRRAVRIQSLNLCFLDKKNLVGHLNALRLI